MPLKAVGMLTALALLSSCGVPEIPPLRVEPAQPVHPQMAQPPKDLMVHECVFLKKMPCPQPGTN